jgi:prepilin-type N-terminal cleavage/methylation domain-containing protein
MINKMRKMDKQGFTLIELMIVIAIIGILAAIAIPNFIAYRNKSFCSRAESDANGIAAAISDYFSIATHTSTPALSELNNSKGYTLSGTNSGTITGANANVNITITVTDGSGRCPTDYMTAQPYNSSNKTSGWDSTNKRYVKYISF